MKRALIPMLLIFFASSCSLSFLRDKMMINELIQYKEKLDKTENPAEAYMIKADLASKIVVLDGLVVKDIVESTIIDYQYCVISELDTEKGKIECHIYTKNIRRISHLVKGQTKINVKGEFSRFFSTLDNYYTKVEVINSSITIIEPEEK